MILVEKGIVDDAATFYANSGFVVNFSPTVFANIIKFDYRSKMSRMSSIK